MIFLHKVVKSMICKESHAFNTFVAVRLGEIHHADEWYWMYGYNMIAEWITGGKWRSGP